MEFEEDGVSVMPEVPDRSDRPIADADTGSSTDLSPSYSPR